MLFSEQGHLKKTVSSAFRPEIHSLFATPTVQLPGRSAESGFQKQPRDQLHAVGRQLILVCWPSSVQSGGRTLRHMKANAKADLGSFLSFFIHLRQAPACLGTT